MALPANWLGWGYYCVGVHESGTTFGDTNLGWNRVESDYLFPTQRLYGGGLGIIQLTSSNFEMLLRIAQAQGVVGFPAGTLLNDLNSGTASQNYAVGSNSPNGGVFTLAEAQWLSGAFLTTETSKQIQSTFIRQYAANLTYIHNAVVANISDIQIAAYIAMVEVWAPAYAYSLTQAPVPTSLDMADQQCAELAGCGVGDGSIAWRTIAGFHTIAAQVPSDGSAPPVDILTYEAGTSTTSPPGPGNDGGIAGSAPASPQVPLVSALSLSEIQALLGGRGLQSKGVLNLDNTNPRVWTKNEAWYNRVDKKNILILPNSSAAAATLKAASDSQAASENAANANKAASDAASGVANGAPGQIITTPNSDGSPTVPPASGPAKVDTNWLDSIVGQVVGNGQCYGLAAAYSVHMGYPDIEAGGAVGPNPGGLQPGLGAAWIPWDFPWMTPPYAPAGVIKATDINITPGMLMPGDIISFYPTAQPEPVGNAPYGHVGILGFNGVFYQQNVSGAGWDSSVRKDISLAQMLGGYMIAGPFSISGFVRFTN